jgi:group I intron endonuclease
MIIYKCQNKLSNKVYIGQTTKSLNDRIQQHIKVANQKAKSKFHKALISYGIDNFDWIIIDTANSKDELNKLEIYYIKEYNSIDIGYNMVDGGTGGYNQMAVDANKLLRTGKTYSEIYKSPEMVEIILKSRHDKVNNNFEKFSKEQRIKYAKIGNAARTAGGYTHTNETKQKMSDTQIGISYEDRHGKEKAQLLKSKISDATKEAMKKVDWDVLMGKALESRNKFWDSKHDEQKKKIIELKAQNIPIKTIIAQLNISTPTYYKLWNSIKNK